MQLKRQANSTARGKALVAKTKEVLSSITKIFNYSEIEPCSVPPRAPSATPPASFDGEPEPESELFYPLPPFTRTFTSGSQLSGSTKSTSTAASSIFSCHTYQTTNTAAGEEKELYSGKDDTTTTIEEAANADIVQTSLGLVLPHITSCGNEQVQSSTSLMEWSNDGEHSEASSENEEEDDDEGALFMRAKRTKPFRSYPTTSLPRNPYAAFLSQPLYKPSYIFPTARRT
ncbi:hypothetical protein FRC04_008268 [Tulasnella sp. 424]|nr:hypothetical protein FRC04_008268 [Tulasnella sp. 424]KAG8966915.1 hypothetical protein FRC05_002363 [Tulasnella sp. 425]